MSVDRKITMHRALEPRGESHPMSQEIKKKQVCRCENCGNEAEMVVTCSMPSVETEEKKETEKPPMVPEGKADESGEDRVKGTAVCSHCGNEADMWVDL